MHLVKLEWQKDAVFHWSSWWTPCSRKCLQTPASGQKRKSSSCRLQRVCAQRPIPQGRSDRKYDGLSDINHVTCHGSNCPCNYWGSSPLCSCEVWVKPKPTIHLLGETFSCGTQQEAFCRRFDLARRVSLLSLDTSCVCNVMETHFSFPRRSFCAVWCSHPAKRDKEFSGTKEAKWFVMTWIYFTVLTAQTFNAVSRLSLNGSMPAVHTHTEDGLYSEVKLWMSFTKFVLDLNVFNNSQN